ALTYRTSDSTGRSLLAQVDKCGALGGCLQPKKFRWESSKGIEFQRTTVTSGLTPSLSKKVLDMDGDGRDELLMGEVGVLFRSPDASHPLEEIVHNTLTRPGVELDWS